MKVTILSQYFWPEENATSDLMSGIATGLVQQGFEVTAIAGQPSYRDIETLPRVLEHEGVRVRRVPSTRFDKNRLPGRAINMVTFTVSLFFSSLFMRRSDAVIAVTNPPFLILVVRLLTSLRGMKSVLLIHDLYPEVAIALGHLRKGSLTARFWSAFNRWSYRGATRIIALGECMAELLRQQVPAELLERIVVIPNWANGDVIKPVPRENHPLIREWEVEGKFVVLYSGNIGRFHELETVTRAAEILAEKDSSILFQFIGDGGQLTWLKSEVGRLSLKNVAFQPFQSKERLPLSLTACDAGLVTLKKEATGCCVPSKLYGMLAAGRPVLGVLSRQSETAKTIERHGCGIVVQPGDAEGLAEGVIRLKSDPDLVNRLGEAARHAYECHYTVEKVAEAYGTLLRSVDS